MNRLNSFQRKIAYIVAIAILLLPLAALSQPATVGAGGGTAGGKLSQLRIQYNLAQARLGEIDPASETMKLATLGLRGVAANVLWGWANYYKKVEDWDKLELTVQQIIRLQPNFLEVWDFQAHNLSYNVSAEFDDYRMRYHWVKEGIGFLIEGTHYNRDEPGLLNQVGWFVGQKVGRADEQKQFRRMFRDDRDFHALFLANGIDVDQEAARGPDAKPDNWLVSRLWFNKAVDSVTYSGKPIRGKTPLLFYSGPGMSQINGSAAMQKDGYFFERAQRSWEKALAEWRDFGNRELPSTPGYIIRLNDKEDLDKRIALAYEEIDRLTPGVREQIKTEKIAALPDDQKAARAKPEADRTTEEQYLAAYAEGAIRPTAREFVAHAPSEVRAKVRQLADQIENDQEVANTIDRNRHIVNFVYWRTRCEAEQSTLGQSARKAIYDADKLFSQGEKYGEARKLYEDGWVKWAGIYEKYPILLNNAESQDLIDSVRHYRDLLNQLDEPFPRDFVLTDLLNEYEEGKKILAQARLLDEVTGKDEKDAAKPTEDQPKENQPSDQQPKGDQQEANQRKEAKPAEGKPAGEQPAEDSKGKAGDQNPEKTPAEKPADKSEPDDKGLAQA